MNACRVDDLIPTEGREKEGERKTGRHKVEREGKQHAGLC